MKSTKEFRPVRYAYGVAMALLLGGTAFSVATGQAGAQVAQNAPSAIVPRAGAPTSFADLGREACAGGGQYLDQAARAGPAPGRSVRGIFPPLRRAGARRTRAKARARAKARGQGQEEPQTREAGSLGSGFIISPDGYVVTNNHLIQGVNGTGTVDSVTITLPDRREFPARIIGRDTRIGSCPAEDRRFQPALRQLGRFHSAPGSATGWSRSATPMALAAR